MTIAIQNIAVIKDLIKKGLENKVYDAVLGLFWDNNNNTVHLAITSEIKNIDKLEVLCPSMPVQAARVISNIKFTETDLRVLCIIKPCEMRAVVELVKLKQIIPDKLIFMSMDCGGALEPDTFKKLVEEGKAPISSYLTAFDNFVDFSYQTENPRFACKICDKCIPKLSDLRIRSYGKTKYIQALTEKGKKFLMDVTEMTLEQINFESYDAEINKLVKNRIEARNKEREIFKKEVSSIDAFTKELSACIRCHNCMVNCPADYCKECIFRSPVFDHPSENYSLWLERKGYVKLPSDTLLFHLTRLNHMSTSCVSCGMCETSCPVGIRLTRIFSFIGEETQKIFNYESGRSFDEELPVATFREKELDKI
jgi:formate dehydrogenase subunit beta